MRGEMKHQCNNTPPLNIDPSADNIDNIHKHTVHTTN